MKIFPDLKNKNHQSIILTGLNKILYNTQTEEFLSKETSSKSTSQLKLNSFEKNKVYKNHKSRKLLEPLSQLSFTSSKEIIINTIYPKKKRHMSKSISNLSIQPNKSVKCLSDISALDNNLIEKKSIYSESNDVEFESAYGGDNLNKIIENENDVTIIISEEDLIKHFVLIENWMEFDHVSSTY